MVLYRNLIYILDGMERALHKGKKKHNDRAV